MSGFMLNIFVKTRLIMRAGVFWGAVLFIIVIGIECTLVRARVFTKFLC